MTTEPGNGSELEKKPATATDAVRGGAVTFGKILLTAALTALISNIVTYQMWLIQQDKLQAWNSKPIVDVKIDTLKGRKDLAIRNLGSIDIDDVKVFVTVYELAARPIDGGRHTTWDGIASSSKGGALRTFAKIPASGGFESINLLTEFQQFAPMHKWEPGRSDKLMNTYYAYRVTFRNGVTKQRYVALLFATPFSDFNANPFGEAETTSGGGGYAAGKHLVELRNLLKRDQLDLYDDSPSDLYQK